MIHVMEKKMLEEVRILDTECFNPPTPRTMENIESLYENNPNGCFVVMNDETIVGYIFSRILGNHGFIGPIGIKPVFRSKSLGKNIIQHCISSLKDAGCTSIGLETLAELPDNIGLYLKMGFMPTFPTIMFQKILPYKCDMDPCIVNGQNIDYSQLQLFDNAFVLENKGYSFFNDLKYVLSKSPENVHFYRRNEDIIAFLGYTPYLYPFVWGAFLESGCTKEIFLKLYTQIEKDNQQNTLKIRVNTRYQRAMELLSSDFKVDKCLMRLVLKDYEGEFEKPNCNTFSARAWIG